MKKTVLLLILLFAVFRVTMGQNTWPKSYAQPGIFMYNVIQDIDHGFLVVAQFNYDGNTYLLKFDANANLLWKKCLHYIKTPELSATHFIKDHFYNTYIIGTTWDTDPVMGDAFILQLDSTYRKVKSMVYTDTVGNDQQYFGCSFDFNDSLLTVFGSGFNQFSNHFLFIRKPDFSVHSIYNTEGGSVLNNILSLNNSNYFTFRDWYHLKGGDTNLAAIRTPILKFSASGKDLKYFKFFGYDNDLLSHGYKLFYNKKGTIFVFSSYFSERNGSIQNKRYSPMVFECDTNGEMLNYRVYSDSLINQELYDVLQFYDSTYFMLMDWYTGSTSGSGLKIRKIKIYKLDANANRIDSVYLTNNGKSYYKDGHSSSFLIKTFDNKIMCVLNEVDSNFSNPRISFVRLDANLKQDTTRYRNLQYDFGLSIPNDTLTLSSSPITYLHADTTFPELKLEKPSGTIKLQEVTRYAFYPNPVKETATLSIQNPHNGFVEIVLFNANGQLVQEMYKRPGEGYGEECIPLNLATNTPGMYYIKVFVAHHLQHIIKIVKEE